MPFNFNELAERIDLTPHGTPTDQNSKWANFNNAFYKAVNMID
jgi:hypothetical protein